MNRNALVTSLLCAGIASGAVPALAQRATDDHVRELIQAAAERAGVNRGSAPSPGPARQQPASTDTRPTIDLTLDDAVTLALDRNLGIAVQRLNPSTFEIGRAHV